MVKRAEKLKQKNSALVVVFLFIYVSVSDWYRISSLSCTVIIFSLPFFCADVKETSREEAKTEKKPTKDDAYSAFMREMEDLM